MSEGYKFRYGGGSLAGSGESGAATQAEPAPAEQGRTSSSSDVQSRMHKAKHPISPVAGPYGHPIHPMLVPVPIGAWVASLVFDIASYYVDDPSFLFKGAYWLIATGVVAALLAAVFGLLDLVAIPRGSRPFKVALVHMAMNVTLVAVFTASFFVRVNQSATEEVDVWLVVVSAVAILALLISGILGGRLSYHYGVRVTAETKQAEGYV